MEVQAVSRLIILEDNSTGQIDIMVNRFDRQISINDKISILIVLIKLELISCHV